MEELEKKVYNTIQKYNLIEDEDKIVLGVSGGPDSIAMLQILDKIRKSHKINFSIFVAHVHHGLRKNADLDEKFVIDFCSKKEIECFVLHSEVAEIAKQEKIGLEEAGRKVRYEFFEEIREKTNSNKIAIAHHLNDHVETVLMNVLRGSGEKGLRGIEAKNGYYIRPLIEQTRLDIEKYLENEKIVARHDESNDENEFTRNKIRNIVIPYIEKEFNPNFIQTMSRLSSIIKEEDNYLDEITKKNYELILVEEKNLEKEVYNKQELPTIILDLKKFNCLDIIIEKRILFYAIYKIFNTTKGIEKIHIDDMIKLCNNNIGNKYLTPNKKTKIVIKNKKIYIMAIK